MVTSEVRMFPILTNRYKRKESWGDLTEIPWAMIAPFSKRAKRNHSQSLETLADRGGLSPSEAIAVLDERNLFSGDHSLAGQRESTKRLHEMIAQFLDEEQSEII